jgi:phosphoenolpyruvate---glycerone phosphotransferase subunit DhaL
VGRAGPDAGPALVAVIDGDGARAWIGSFIAAFGEQRASLDDLDRRSGDGDFGSNLLPAIEGALVGADALGPGRAFTVLGRACMAAGGTSGPLFGVWFRELGRAGGDEPALDLGALAGGVAAGLEAVRKLGGARVGDKTMVDAMAPAATALADACERGERLGSALDAAAAAAREGAVATAALTARRGRASYVGEASRGVEDPGAVAVALFFESHPPSNHGT